MDLTADEEQQLKTFHHLVHEQVRSFCGDLGDLMGPTAAVVKQSS
eukprot:gene6131-6370_t